MDREDRHALCSTRFMILLTLLAVLVLVLPAVLFPHFSLKQRSSNTFRVGTPVVYEHDEVTNCPLSGASDVRPAEHGEYYYCSILDYLRVVDVLGDGRIIALAQNQQRLCFDPKDSGLRKARLSERLFHPLRFPR